MFKSQQNNIFTNSLNIINDNTALFKPRNTFKKLTKTKWFLTYA